MNSQVCCKLGDPSKNPNSIILAPPIGRTSRRSELTQAVRTESSVREKQIFAFDYVYGDHVDDGGGGGGMGASGDLVAVDRNSQELVYKDLGLKVLENAFQGFNCSMLAYGQTGSGQKGRLEAIQSGKEESM